MRSSNPNRDWTCEYHLLVVGVRLRRRESKGRVRTKASKVLAQSSVVNGYLSGLGMGDGVEHVPLQEVKAWLARVTCRSAALGRCPKGRDGQGWQQPSEMDQYSNACVQ